ncbi:hypothetical protein M3193_04210 [Sporosarcina luteola]|uniref:hypothetical protein n=1 Tax=Sporosarcina luteola TaxID=582850 RepID=UPI00203BCBE8|nr:hypothetical protein [Sporosarcina luteola]MCM3743334.1 hypothetical protein [Sporosarcina luteola]
MSRDIESHVPIKEIIFNERQYSKTKKSLAMFYIVLLAYFRATQNYILGGTWVAIGVIDGIIYIVSKLFFYNESKKIRDIVFLIVLFGLLIWGIYTLNPL